VVCNNPSEEDRQEDIQPWDEAVAAVAAAADAEHKGYYEQQKVGHGHRMMADNWKNVEVLGRPCLVGHHQFLGADKMVFAAQVRIHQEIHLHKMCQTMKNDRLKIAS
jgi:hypothetical protein